MFLSLKKLLWLINTKLYSKSCHCLYLLHPFWDHWWSLKSNWLSLVRFIKKLSKISHIDITRMQLTFTVVFKAHQNLFTHLTHLTNRFHVAVNLYSCNRSQMMSNVVTTKECYTRRHHWFLDQIFISFALLHRPVETDIEYIYFIS